MPATLDDLRGLIDRYVTVPPAPWSRFVALLQEREYPRHRHLLRIGHVSGELAFIQRGLVRRYVREGACEVNTGFLREGSFANAFTSFTRQQPSAVALQALEDTRLLTLSHEAMQALSREHPCWQQFALGAAAFKLEQQVEREAALLACSAAERYRRLTEAWPAIELRVPLYHIASYLGIAPETLSRLRRQRTVS